ncbi:MAG: GGDEF domain-containing protein [Jannaschia sp.]
MEKAVQLLAPKGVLGWATRIMLILVPVSIINVPAHYYLGGSWDETIMSVVVRTWLVALPFTVFGLALVAYLDRLRRDLAHLASTDMLTGLPNRRAFLDAATHAADISDGAVLMIDVDHFKKINDTYGHAIGDLCLIALAEQLRRVIRDTDHCGRLGGEEFAIWLNCAGEKRARGVGRILTAGLPFPEEASVPRDKLMTVSVGVALAKVGSPISTLLAQADEALYQAKTNGRAQLQVHSRGEDQKFQTNQAEK